MTVISLFQISVILLINAAAGQEHTCTKDSIVDIVKLHTIVNTKFFLSTSKYKSLHEINPESNLSSYGDFPNNTKTVVLIHGFSQSSNEQWVQDARELLLKSPSTNVIAVNWAVHHFSAQASFLENTIVYKSAVQYMPNVVKNIAKLLSYKAEPARNWGYLHIVGHSLGAHIAGQVAETLKAANVYVHRITGLDPAAPCFEHSSLRLDKKNAELVDVIHTNSGPEGGHLGLHEAVGHVDIYPINADNQPECTCLLKKLPQLDGNPVISYFSELIIGKPEPELAKNLICCRPELLKHHYKAPEYFVQFLKHRNCKFWAIRQESLGAKPNLCGICKKNKKSCIAMGLDAAEYKGKSGKYYIDMEIIDQQCPKMNSFNYHMNIEMPKALSNYISGKIGTALKRKFPLLAPPVIKHINTL